MSNPKTLKSVVRRRQSRIPEKITPTREEVARQENEGGPPVKHTKPE